MPLQLLKFNCRDAQDSHHGCVGKTKVSGTAGDLSFSREKDLVRGLSCCLNVICSVAVTCKSASVTACLCARARGSDTPEEREGLQETGSL